MNHDNPLCHACGACCRDNVPVEDADAVPASMTMEIAGQRWMRPHAVAPWCGALDLETRRCTIYEQRPRVCREFEVNGPRCAIARSRATNPPAIPVRVVE